MIVFHFFPFLLHRRLPSPKARRIFDIIIGCPIFKVSNPTYFQTFFLFGVYGFNIAKHFFGLCGVSLTLMHTTGATRSSTRLLCEFCLPQLPICPYPLNPIPPHAFRLNLCLASESASLRAVPDPTSISLGKFSAALGWFGLHVKFVLLSPFNISVLTNPATAFAYPLCQRSPHARACT